MVHFGQWIGVDTGILVIVHVYQFGYGLDIIENGTALVEYIFKTALYICPFDAFE